MMTTPVRLICREAYDLSYFHQECGDFARNMFSIHEKFYFYSLNRVGITEPVRINARLVGQSFWDHIKDEECLVKGQPVNQRII